MSETTLSHGPIPAAADLQVEKLVYGGDGLARLNGQVLLVPFVLPGERISVHPERAKGGILRGSNLQVLELSPARVTPRCEYFYTCGGCQYQHAQYEFQLQQKQAILRETMRRIGGIGFDGDIDVISGEPWFYRNRIQLHFENGHSGFHKAGSNQLVAIDHCEISSPVLRQAIAALQHAVKDPRWPRFLRSLELFTNERELQLTVIDSTRPLAAKFFEWCATVLPNSAPGAIDYQAAGHPFRISRGSFFQVNRFLIDSLINESIGRDSGAEALDLYAGVGLFSLPLAERYRHVLAVERGGPAHRDLEWNARSFSNLEAIKSSAEDALQSLSAAPDLVMADPPRTGLDRGVTEQLLRLRPPLMTIVSCDPATLSRDLKRLLPAYRIDRLAMVDLFPQTYHFETVVHLRRK